jgi:hypothetical protein
MTTTNQRYSKRQEGRITKSLKQLGEEARTQMASGAMWFAKSDVVSKLFRIEAKTRAKEGQKSIKFEKEWLTKVAEECIMENRIPAVAFSFGDSIDYFVLRDRDFYSLIEELAELREKVSGNDKEQT